MSERVRLKKKASRAGEISSYLLKNQQDIKRIVYLLLTRLLEITTQVKQRSFTGDFGPNG